MDQIIPFFNKIYNYLVNFLPDSPFTAYIDLVGKVPYLAWLNWFFPIDAAIAVFFTWLEAFVAVYAFRSIMRQINLIK